MKLLVSFGLSLLISCISLFVLSICNNERYHSKFNSIHDLTQFTVNLIHNLTQKWRNVIKNWLITSHFKYVLCNANGTKIFPKVKLTANDPRELWCQNVVNFISFK